MICKNCGTEILVEGSKFCNNCGASLKFAEKVPDIQMTPKEEPEEIAYYDPYIEEVVKKGKDPICGRIGLGLYLGAVALRVIIGLKSGGAFISTLAVSVALTPLIILLLIGALTLAIVSMVRKERKACADITIGCLFLSVILYVANVLMM